MSKPFECRVGGIVFHTTVDILLSVADSFFCAALNDAWNSSGANFITVDRDGVYFQHILDYLRFGHLPRDSAGRCNIPKEALEALLIESDFYVLPLLTKEIDQLVKYNLKGMRYFINSFFLNSGPSGGLSLKEFNTFDEAHAVYEKHKTQSIQPSSCVNNIYDSINDIDDEYGQNIVVNEESNPTTGRMDFEVFEEKTMRIAVVMCPCRQQQ